MPEPAHETGPAEHPGGPGPFAVNVARGAVIGAVEVVPGVSGGTMALVVGVYDTLINAAGSLVRGAVTGTRALIRREDRTVAREHLRDVPWRVLLPLALGMIAAIIVVAALLAPVLENNPVEARALFAGLIVASLIVPIRMVSRWNARTVLAAVIAAVFAFWLTGLTGVPKDDPTLLMVAGSASIAVCALVLPGVSGSFLLVVLGMYAPTLAAVNERDFAYLSAFVIGAILGLSLFVTGLQWLLTHRRDLTLAAMAGLMAGSLRALWPWQAEDGSFEPPSGDVVVVVALFLLGVALIAALLLAERAVKGRTSEPVDVSGA
jgi:putative membrane protein